MRLLISLLWLGIPVGLICQDISKDIPIVQEILNGHPSKLNPRPRYPILIQPVASVLHSKSVSDLHLAIAGISSGQTQLVAPDSFLKKWNMTTGFFPISIHYSQQKMFNLSRKHGIPFGAEIQTIEGLKIKQLIQQLYPFCFGDAFVESGRWAYLEQHFYWLIRLLFGEKDNFQVTFSHRKKQLDTLTIPSVDLAKIKKLRQSNLIRSFSRQYGLGFEPKVYFANLEKQKLAILRVNSFKVTPSDFHSFLNGYFKKLSQQGFKKLILDLRFNQSTELRNAELLASFLLQDKVTNALETKIISPKISAPKQLKLINQFPSKDLLSKIEAVLTRDFLPANLGFEKRIEKIAIQYKQDQKNPKNKVLESEGDNRFGPDKNAFRGKIILLGNRNTQNAATHTIQLIKRGNPKAILVGEELGSASEKQYTGMMLQYALPSGLELQVPYLLYHYKRQNRGRKTDGNRGLFPDEIVLHNTSSIRQKTDVEMTKAWQILGLEPPKRGSSTLGF